MNYKYKISIITVNKNNKKGLEKTLESIISQNNQEFEWIVIDGGSSDGSKKILEEYNEHIDYWVSEPDNGIYHGMNKGISKAKGEYLLFLNSGDFLYENNTIDKVMTFIQDKDLYVGNVKSEFGSLNISTDSLSLLTVIFEMTLPHQATFIKKNLLIKHGLYNENLKICSDWEFFLKVVVLENCTLKKIPYTISYIDENGISNTDFETNFQERNKILKSVIRIKELYNFYKYNKDIINCIRYNRLTWFLFRIIFYCYRLVQSKKR